MDAAVIVVGAGHAGIEAALAVARLDLEVLLITQHLDTIGKLSCNPAIGGLAKGNMVREIDALGGEMGRLIDDTMIQFRILNRSRGPAVQAPRAQADKPAYHLRAKEVLENQSGLYLFQDTVTDLILSSNGQEITGVATARGRRFQATQVVLTTGTFLNGKIYIGEYTTVGGRLGESAAHGLERTLKQCGFRLGRLKTGTPARVHRDSLDLDKMEPQFGDAEIVPFSFEERTIGRPQLPCYMTYTNARTHKCIQDNINRSPLYSGKIVGNGPRYCPSIEDKVVKFPDRDRHQIFIEPEGLTTKEMYLNGISSSMPEEIQERFIHTIRGLEQAYIMRPGYAVEYDYIDPSQLYPSLESKLIKGLYIAGQTNGSSGYEEAAGQGLIAGINAARAHRGTEPLVLSRSEAYIGVMIDDLVTLGTQEPYRMFTSRAEHRLALRYDSCDQRLSNLGHEIGLLSEERYHMFCEKYSAIEDIKALLRTTHVDNKIADQCRQPAIKKKTLLGKSLYDLLRMPEMSLTDLCALEPTQLDSHNPQWLRQVELDIKYEGYVVRQEEQIGRFKRLESLRIPEDLDYQLIHGLSNESREKFLAINPRTVGQAARISGVRNSDVALLMLHVSYNRRRAH